MYIEIKSDNGKFTIGNNSSAKLLSVSGLGIPQKTFQTVTYEGQPGQITLSETDQYRTITLSFDIEGRASEAQRLYKILYKPCDILIFAGHVHRKISGRVSDMQDIEKVIAGQMWKAAVQFTCDNPYFEDFSKVCTNIFGRRDNLPNSSSESELQIKLPVVATERFNKNTVKNSGDLSTFPIISIKNSGSNTSGYITVSNLTTGRNLKLNYAMPTGTSVTVDIENRKITDNSGTNLIKNLDDSTSMKDFSLIPGHNLIEVTEEDENGAVLDCSLTFTNKYLTAVI